MHMFGFRRHANESIHSIRPVSDIFSDIITVYGMDYVISGPVWDIMPVTAGKKDDSGNPRGQTLRFHRKNRYPPFTDPCSKQSLSGFTK